MDNYIVRIAMIFLVLAIVSALFGCAEQGRCLMHKEEKFYRESCIPGTGVCGPETIYIQVCVVREVAE